MPRGPWHLPIFDKTRFQLTDNFAQIRHEKRVVKSNYVIPIITTNLGLVVGAKGSFKKNKK